MAFLSFFKGSERNNCHFYKVTADDSITENLPPAQSFPAKTYCNNVTNPFIPACYGMQLGSVPMPQLHRDEVIQLAENRTNLIPAERK